MSVGDAVRGLGARSSVVIDDLRESMPKRQIEEIGKRGLRIQYSVT